MKRKCIKGLCSYRYDQLAGAALSPESGWVLRVMSPHNVNKTSSGSDSELSVKKLMITPLAHPHQHKQRKSKARTKLSPIAKADYTHQPNPLVTSIAPSRTLSLSPPLHTQALSTSSTIIRHLRPSMTAESAPPLARVL